MAPSGTGRCSDVSAQPSPIFSAFVGELFQSPYQLRGPHWTCPNSSKSLVCWGHRTVLQVGSHKAKGRGAECLDAAQGAFGFLGCEHTLSACVKFFINHYFILFSPKSSNNRVVWGIFKPRGSAVVSVSPALRCFHVMFPPVLSHLHFGGVSPAV